MSPSPFLLQLAILFLPGVVWAHLDAKFATKGSPSQVEFLARSLFFGLVSYAATYVLFGLLGHPFEMIDFNQVNDHAVITKPVAIQIISATAVGFLLSVIWMYGVRFKWLTRILQKIGATRTYGDEDVWDFTLNSRSAVSEYVHYRDFENEIVYAGWILLFSETEKLRELVLRDVQVFDFNGSLLFEQPRIYIARKAEGMHLEFPATQAQIAPEKAT